MSNKNHYRHLMLPILLLSCTVSAHLAVEADPYSDGSSFLNSSSSSFSSSYLVLDPPTLSSSTCDETYGFLPCTTSVVGNLFLILAYGFLMYLSSGTVANGSEHMLQSLGPGLVGGLILPVLGSFPDAMLVLASGLGGSTETAQSQLTVGIGYLAGSTVLSLSAVWGTCVVAGKCDLHDSIALDQTDTRGFSLTGSGVSTDIWSSYTARIMAVSVTPFLVVQIPQALSSSSAKHMAVLVTFVFSLSFFLSYCIYQVIQPWIQHRRVEYVKHKNSMVEGLFQHSKSTNSDVIEDAASDVEQEAGRIMSTGGVGGGLVAPTVKLVAGTALAAAFSDPLVDAVDNFSSATGIPSFFVAFVILPLATTSSDLVSGLIFASKKNQKSTSLNFEMIYGSVTMNNVLSLSVFLGIVYIRGLTWEFSAEAVVVLVVCLAVGGFASFRTQFPLWSSLLAFMLYPFSLILYSILYYVCGWS